MIKFGRNYRLTIETGGKDPFDIVVQYPLTLQFTVKRGIGASLNSLDCVVYNLTQQARADIFQDRFYVFSSGSGGGQLRRVVLEAGYGKEMSIIFQGNLFEAGTLRQGSNILTSINARDGYADTNNTQTSKTLQAGTTVRNMLLSLIGDFPNLNQGAVNDNGETLKRPVTLSGNTFELLKAYAPQSVFVDQESVNIIDVDQGINYSGQILVIDADSGLLETPRRNDSGLTVTTLFEPRVQVGQIIELFSTVQPAFNGKYKVAGLTHQGIISGAVGGQLTTTLGLILEGALFGQFKIINHESLGVKQRINLDTPTAQ